MPDQNIDTFANPLETPLQDSELSQLKKQTKDVMIPLLIKIFQIRLEAQQLKEPPSRLASDKNKSSLEDLQKQLLILDNDLKLQLQWIQSCRTQIEKVSAELHDPLSALTDVKKLQANPFMQKSFDKALSSNQTANTEKKTSLLFRIKKAFGI